VLLCPAPREFTVAGKRAQGAAVLVREEKGRATVTRLDQP
jgi:hypothetical protein